MGVPKPNPQEYYTYCGVGILPAHIIFNCVYLLIMERVRSKSDLPEKICVVCQRPFTWRKKWQDCWDEVKYCSERCRRRRSQAKNES